MKTSVPADPSTAQTGLGCPEPAAEVSPLREADRGRLARTPAEIPPRGWSDVVHRLAHAIVRDRVFSLAAGVAFYAVLAIFPALGASVTLYALFADASQAAAHLDLLAGVLPPGAAELLGEQMTRMAAAAGTLGSALLVNLALSVWSANAGVAALCDALNVVFKEEEKRSYAQFYAMTLLFTLFAVAFLALALGLIVVLPVALKYLGWGGAGERALALARWPALYCGVLGVLMLFYRYGPSRTPAQWKWVSPGGAFAAALWLGASIAFSWYVASFDSYSRMYGSLGAIIAFMIWLWLSSVVALLGAEIDAQAELQTAQDTTRGPPKPMGARGAYVADTLGEAQE